MRGWVGIRTFTLLDWIGRMFGDSGLFLSGAVLGISDLDALTISMAKAAATGVAPAVAAHAIAIGILANSILRLSLAITLGSPPFRRASGIVLAAMSVVIALSIGLLRK
jgi:uncharacterized membrane protein (DUF4010 family)